jgi:hypothetical protein
MLYLPVSNRKLLLDGKEKMCASIMNSEMDMIEQYAFIGQ